MLNCRSNTALIFVWLCRPTVTLHQGQGHRNEHEHIRHALVCSHAKFECNSLNNVRDIATTVHYKFKNCQV